MKKTGYRILLRITGAPLKNKHTYIHTYNVNSDYSWSL